MALRASKPGSAYGPPVRLAEVLTASSIRLAGEARRPAARTSGLLRRERMVGLLTPFSNPGTARYQVIERRRRDDFLTSWSEAGDSGS
jgi:hypothetical protein